MLELNMRKRLDAQLPAVKCSPKMESEIKKIAKQHKTSVGEVVRTALSLFLDTIDTNSVSNGTDGSNNAS